MDFFDEFGNILTGEKPVKIEVSLPQKQLVELALYLFVAFLLATIIGGFITKRF